MKVSFSYDQNTVTRFSGTLDVPDGILKEGKDAVEQYIHENEMDANDVFSKVVDFGDFVPGTMEVEEA